jgi:hypothetical protein
LLLLSASCCVQSAGIGSGYGLLAVAFFAFFWFDHSAINFSYYLLLVVCRQLSAVGFSLLPVCR